jgi:hypothetical protein
MGRRDGKQVFYALDGKVSAGTKTLQIKSTGYSVNIAENVNVGA